MHKALACVATIALSGASLLLQTASVSADESGQTIRMLQRVTSQVLVDLGDAGESVGDQESFAGDLFELESANRPGKKLGRAGVVVTTVSFDATTGDGEGVGLATYALESGKVTLRTLVRFSDDNFTAAITGGTGRFQDARGEVELNDIPDSETDGIVIIHLSKGSGSRD